jgi:hypothetical protein
MHLFIYFIYLQLMFISVLQVDLWIGGKWQNDLEIGMPETRKRTEHKKNRKRQQGRETKRAKGEGTEWENRVSSSGSTQNC